MCNYENGTPGVWNVRERLKRQLQYRRESSSEFGEACFPETPGFNSKLRFRSPRPPWTYSEMQAFSHGMQFCREESPELFGLDGNVQGFSDQKRKKLRRLRDSVT